MKVLTSEQLYIQLQAIPPLASTIRQSIVFDCWRVGSRPAVDLIGDDQFRHYECIPLSLSEYVHEMLSESQDGKLILVCDLFAEYNSPPLGNTWSMETRTNGAIVGAMSCLMVFLRCEELKELLFTQPDRLAIVTVHEHSAVYDPSSSGKIIDFIRSKSETSHPSSS